MGQLNWMEVEEQKDVKEGMTKFCWRIQRGAVEVRRSLPPPQVIMIFSGAQEVAATAVRRL